LLQPATRHAQHVGGAGTKKTVGGEASITSLALPAFGSASVQPMIEMMETMYAGHISTHTLAALGCCTSIDGMLLKLFVFLNYGSTPMVAKALVREDGSASPAIAAACMLATAIGCLQCVLLYTASERMIGWMLGAGGSLQVSEQAVSFLQIHSLGAPAQLLRMVATGALRGIQDTQTPLFATLVVAGGKACVLGALVTLSPERASFPALALLGVVAMWTETVLLFFRLVDAGVLRLKDLRVLPHVGTFHDFGVTGSFMLVRTIALRMALTVINSSAAQLSPSMAAAHTIGRQAASTASLISDSLAVAAQSLVAQHLGGKQTTQAREVAVRLIGYGVVVGLLNAGALVLFGGYYAALFTTDAEVLQHAVLALHLLAIVCPFASVSYVLDGIVMGAADFAYMAVAMILSAGVTVAASAVASSTYAAGVFEGLQGAWFTFGVLILMRCATLGVRMMPRAGPLTVQAQSHKLK